MRNVVLLALCQALAMSSNTLVVAVTALAGQALAPEKALATLPLGLQFAATMATTIPASLLMKRFGRRFGFSLGALLGMAAGTVSAAAIFRESFALYCLGAVLFGGSAAHAFFYRFAAADTASEAFKSRAISLVMAGGVLAAFVGPELAKWSRGLFAPTLFAGSYLCIVGLSALALVVLGFVRIPRPGTAERGSGGRPLGLIIRQPAFLIAALSAMVAYGAMNLVMTVTPLAMADSRHPFDAAALVIQWHVLAMFGPAFFTGHLIHRFGVVPIIASGAACLIGSVALNLAGIALLQFWCALVLLGLGWNLMFVGATTLLTEAYRPEERAKTQGLNDFLVFGTVALTAFGSGLLFDRFGWQAVNLGLVIPVVVALSAVLWLARRRAVSAA